MIVREHVMPDYFADHARSIGYFPRKQRLAIFVVTKIRKGRCHRLTFFIPHTFEENDLGSKHYSIYVTTKWKRD